MIIVVSPEATPDDIDVIVARVEETGRQAHLSVGTERSIIGVIGPDDPALQDIFETLPHVESVHRVTKPYKLVSREFHPGNTVIDVGHGVSIGGPAPCVMGRPRLPPLGRRPARGPRCLPWRARSIAAG